MDYEEFKNEFVDAVKEKLARQGSDMNVSVNEVKKRNESYEAMTVTYVHSGVFGMPPYRHYTMPNTYVNTIDKLVHPFYVL